jgi:hypothetical protein
VRMLCSGKSMLMWSPSILQRIQKESAQGVRRNLGEAAGLIRWKFV